MRQRVLFHMMFEMRGGPAAARVAGDRSMAAVISPGMPLWVWTRKDCAVESVRLFFMSFLDGLPACLETGSLPGLIAGPDVANALAGVAADRMGAVGVRHELVALYPPRAAVGSARGQTRARLRPAAAEDAPRLTEWLDAFYRDALGESAALLNPDKPPAPALPDAAAALPSGGGAVSRDMGGNPAALRLYILWHDRRPVAMGALTRGRFGLCRLNLLYVPGPLRRLGYGRETLSALCALAAARGQTPMLYTAADNTAALGLYRAAGFAEAGRLTGWRFKK